MSAELERLRSDNRELNEGITRVQRRCNSLLEEARTARRELAEERELYTHELRRLRLRIDVLEAELAAARGQ